MPKTYYTPPTPKDQENLTSAQWKARFLEGRAEIFDFPQTVLELIATDLPSEVQYRVARSAAKELHKNPYACGKDGRILIEYLLTNWKEQENVSMHLMSFLCDVTNDEESKHIVHVIVRCIKNVLPSFREYSEDVKRIIEELNLWISSDEEKYPKTILQELNRIMEDASKRHRMKNYDLVYRNAFLSAMEILSEFFSKKSQMCKKSIDVLNALQNLYATNISSEITGTEWRRHYEKINYVMCSTIGEFIPSAEDIGLRYPSNFSR